MQLNLNPGEKRLAAFAEQSAGRVGVLEQIEVRDRSRYEGYRVAVAPLLARVGARVALDAACEEVLIGTPALSWSHCVLTEFPSRKRALALWSSAPYREVLEQRDASVNRLEVFGVEAAKPLSLGARLGLRVAAWRVPGEVSTRELMRGGGIDPTLEQLERFEKGPQGSRILMVNFLGFRERARYSDHPPGEAELSGAQAYARYARVAMPLIRKVGGRLVWAGGRSEALVGEESAWDSVAIVSYPAREAFLRMVSRVDYHAALEHRDAGLARTRLLVTTPR